MLPNSVYEKYKEDLDGDGKKEKIVEKNDCLYINGKKILSLSDTDCEFIYWYICDFWKNDNVKEIAILSYPKKFTIYRYKKNKLVKFASENGKNDVFRYMVTDHFIKVPGNGTLVLSQMLYNEKSYQIIGNIFLTLKECKIGFFFVRPGGYALALINYEFRKNQETVQETVSWFF